MTEHSLRSVIDEIALRIDEYDDEDLQALIAAKSMDYIAKLRSRQPMLTEDEIDTVTSVIVSGVLKRLAQIAESGGHLGSA